MANKWITALKKWNEKNEKWCVPRKGTPEYNEVRKIMDEMSGEGKFFDPLKNIVKEKMCEDYYKNKK